MDHTTTLRAVPAPSRRAHTSGIALALLALGALPALETRAHGTMEVPESRIYNCFLNNPENPSDPACAAAKALSGTQPFYDWNEINQANAAGNHRALVPDGQLCSGGRSKYAGMDLARSDWQATPITPKADGTFDFTFWATAPHATDEWVFYITRNGYNGTEPLRWDDLFEFCRLGNVPVGADKRYTLNCPLPQLSGKHVIYTTWQRSDSPEAFYTCTDVVLGDGSASVWADEGALLAQSDLAAGSQVSLRLFNSSGNDMETVTLQLAQDATAAEWALAFANTVNAQSQYARIGVLDPSSDSIAPVQSASQNRVYTQADLNLSHEVDIQPADSGENPGENPGEGPGDGGTDYDFVYPDGIGSYTPGETVVLGSDGKRYQCRPFPEGQWCNINSPFHYAPGTGSNWRDAWIEL